MIKPRLTYLPIAYIDYSKSGIFISDVYFKNSKRVTALSAEQVSESLIQIRYLDENWEWLESPYIVTDTDSMRYLFHYNMGDKILPEFTELIDVKVHSKSLFRKSKIEKVLVHKEGWARLKGEVNNEVIQTSNWLIKTSDSNVKHIL